MIIPISLSPNFLIVRYTPTVVIFITIIIITINKGKKLRA